MPIVVLIGDRVATKLPAPDVFPRFQIHELTVGALDRAQAEWRDFGQGTFCRQFFARFPFPAFDCLFDRIAQRAYLDAGWTERIKDFLKFTVDRHLSFNQHLQTGNNPQRMRKFEFRSLYSNSVQSHHNR